MLAPVVGFMLSFAINVQCSYHKKHEPTSHGSTYIEEHDTTITTIHIKVALCDNEHQGIVPVPGQLGNGQVPRYNLYWGTSHGIKTFFKNSSHWTLVKSYSLNDTILERIVLKHKTKKAYIIADAYDGQYIKQTTIDFLNAAAGKEKDTLHYNEQVLGIHGNANLVAYIGHDGLMDFDLPYHFDNYDNKTRDVIILACYSKSYFQEYLQKARAHPLVLTSGLMAPEAYTIHDALIGYLNNENDSQIVERAAKAYAKYQKCSESAAKKLIIN